MAMIVMFDSMIYDEILASEGVLDLLKIKHSKGHIEIIDTHVQHNQISNIPPEKNDHREKLLDLYEQLRPLAKRVPTAAGVWDVTRWDEGTFGEGTGDLKLDEIIKGNPDKYATDALIAVTAAAHVDVLVTKDDTLRSRIRDSSSELKTMSFDEFSQWLKS